MAKKKKGKEIKRTVTPKTETKQAEVTIYFKDLKVTKSDPLNWKIEKKTEKGGYTFKGYFGNLAIVLDKILKENLVTKKEIKKVKELKEQVETARKEVITLAKQIEKTLTKPQG